MAVPSLLVGSSKDNTVTTRSEEPEVVVEEKAVKSRLSIVVILSILLGILLTIFAAGVSFHFQQRRAMEAEVTAAKVELQEKAKALDEMKAQFEVLSKQVYALREYSIARSHKAVDADKTKATAGASADPAANSPQPSVASGKCDTSATPDSRKPKKKPDSENCELVGKTPEEQAATLKRCVGLMDSPRDKARSR